MKLIEKVTEQANVIREGLQQPGMTTLNPLKESFLSLIKTIDLNKELLKRTRTNNQLLKEIHKIEVEIPATIQDRRLLQKIWLHAFRFRAKAEDKFIEIVIRETFQEILSKEQKELLINTEHFEKDLKFWKKNSSYTGDKNSASERIRNAYYQQSSYLILDNLGLSHLPDALRYLSDLEELSVKNNELSHLPYLGDKKKLKILSISNNKIFSIPDEIGQMIKLEEIHADDNQLSNIPYTIGFLNHLRILSLNNNNLITLPPHIGNLTNLETLNLEKCDDDLKEFYGFYQPIYALTIPREIGALTNLRNLNLNNNKLTKLPNTIEGLSHLRNLSLYGNPLEKLPMGLKRIENLKIEPEQRDEIFIEEPMPSPDDLFPELSFEEIFDKVRQELLSWQLATNAGEVDFEFLTTFGKVEIGLLYSWLKRLSDAQDFFEVKQRFARLVCSMVASLEDHEDFKELFFKQIQVNLENCEDRAAMAFNELYSSWRILTIPPSASMKEKLTLLIGAAKTNTLRKVLEKKLNGRELPESVEIYLYYEINLRKPLELDTAIRSMAHGRLGKCDWVNEDELIRSVEQQYKKTLIDFPAFKKIAKEDFSYATQKAKIKAGFQKRREIIENNELDSEEYRRALDALLVERKNALESLAIEWLNEHLNA